MIFATAGHVDHGKTFLVKNLTGAETDRLPEEKKRGMSIDLGFAYKKINNQTKIGIIDVPGHENFTHNMIAGLTSVEFVLLVIAADDGPKAQTYEHLEILNLLGIKDGAIAITKIDKVDNTRIIEIENDVKVMLKETSLSRAPIFPVSSLNKNGIETLQKFLVEKANGKNSLNASGAFRLAIDRKFYLNGIGLIVTGSVLSGKVEVDDDLVVSPKNITARIKSIHSNNNNSKIGYAGQRCALNLKVNKKNKDLIQRGDWLLSKFINNPSNCVDANICVSFHLKKPIKNWSCAYMHVGSAKIICRIIILEKKEISPGTKGLVHLKLEKKTSLVFGDRFILRDTSAKNTIAGGQIIDPNSSPKGRTKPERIECLNFQINTGLKESLLLLISKSTWGIDLIKFSISRNLTFEELQKLLLGLQFKIITHKHELWGISDQNWNLCKKIVYDFISKSIANDKTQLDVNEDKILSVFSYRTKSFVVKKILFEFIEANKVFKNGQKISITKNIISFNSREQILWNKIKSNLNEILFNPVSINEVSKEINIDLKKVENIFNKSVYLGQLYKISEKYYFLPKIILECAKIIEKIAKKNKEGLVDLVEFRNETKMSRNISIELLEFFDKKQFTVRVGDRRTVKTNSSNIFK